MKRYLQFLLILLTTIFMMAGCSQRSSTTGTLEGHITYGPISPVEKVGEPTPTPNPQFYAGLEVIIYREDGKTIVSRVPVDGTGNFHAELPIGTYVIDMNMTGIKYSKDLPVVVEIKDAEITKVEIFIDTGIR